jgi:uncharacterized membrane protein HdeD (DUF308 family)
MLLIVAPRWWALLVRGILAIAFGVVALVWPGITVWALVLLFGAYAAVDGVLSLYAAINGEGRRNRWWLALEGVLGLAAAVVAIVWPGITALALLCVVAAWAFVTGIAEIAMAVELRREITNEWAYVLLGAASIILAVALVVRPRAGIVAITWVIGVYAIVIGVLLSMLSFRIRRLEKAVEQQRAAVGEAWPPAGHQSRARTAS